MTSKHDYIQEAAYYIWLNRGRPDGQDLEIWDEATKIYELTQKVLKPIEKKVPAKKVSKKSSAKKTVKKNTKVIKAVAPVISIDTKKAPNKKVSVKKASTSKVVATKKTVEKKSIKVAVKPAKKVVEKKAPAKTVEVAKIIPMVKKETSSKKAMPKTKIKIIVGKKK